MESIYNTIVKDRRPDIVIKDDTNKTVLIIDIACPFDNRTEALVDAIEITKFTNINSWRSSLLTVIITVKFYRLSLVYWVLETV